MENNILVTIVMPVYNAKNYIKKAIDSILKQTYKNFELIIVDDGASDGTGEICEEYAKKFTNVSYIKEKNMGTCVARNNGIIIAKGDYIAFSDHDDEYCPNYLEELVNYAQTNSLDVVKCGVFYEETYANGEIRERKESFDRKVVSVNEIVQNYNSLPISYFAVWNTLYKTKILKDNHLEFPKHVRHGQEDYFFNTSVIPYIKRVGFVEKCLYKHYRRLEQSTSAKFYYDRIDHMAEYLKLECQILKPFVDESKWRKEYGVLYARKITGVLSYVFSTNKIIESKKAVGLVERYLINAKYTEEITLKDYCSILFNYRKYFVVLFLVRRKKIPLLIKIWKYKNINN